MMAMERETAGGTPLAMLVRRLWPDHNPLRRTADRAEFAVVAVLLAAFVIGAPVTALAAAQWAAASSMRSEKAQAGWHRVPAVLLHDTPRLAGSLSFPAPVPQVRARWAGPAGPRTGKVYARPGARASSVVMVWTDRSGRLTGPPVPAATMADQVLLAAVSAPAALALVLVAVWVYASLILDRRRMAAWDADWSVTGPQWTGQR
jgi:hypothetical protein